MKEVKEPPKSGQFIAVWEYKNKPWSTVFRYKKGKLQEYNQHKDSWISSHLWDINNEEVSFRYFVL